MIVVAIVIERGKDTLAGVLINLSTYSLRIVVATQLQVLSNITYNKESIDQLLFTTVLV